MEWQKLQALIRLLLQEQQIKKKSDLGLRYLLRYSCMKTSNQNNNFSQEHESLKKMAWMLRVGPVTFSRGPSLCTN